MSWLKEGLFTPNYFSFTCHMIKQTRVCSLFRGLWSIAPSFKREEMQTMPTSSFSAHWGHPAGEPSGWGPQLESQTKQWIHKQHQPFWDANVPTTYASMQTAQAQQYAQLLTWHTLGKKEKELFGNDSNFNVFVPSVLHTVYPLGCGSAGAYLSLFDRKQRKHTGQLASLS